MFNVYLKSGLKFKLDNKYYEILRINETGIVTVIEIEYNDTIQFKRSELIQYLSQGRLKFEVQGKNKIDDKISTNFNIEDIENSKHKEIAKFRYGVISPLLTLDRGKKLVLDRINYINNLIDNKDEERIKEELKCKYYKRIAFSTVYRWISDYEKSNRDVRALLPSYHKSGGKNKARLQETIIQYMNEVIESYYKSTQRITINEAYYLVINKITDHNKYAHKPIKIPSLSTFRRYIIKIPEFELVEARFSKRRAKNEFEKIGSGVQVRYPLERVEIDTTPIDILLKVEENNSYERPYMVAAIDKYTRNIVGFSIGLGSVGWPEVMQCIRHIMMDKSYIKTKYPEIENEWSAFGVPKKIVIDNGREYKNKAMEDAAFQLGFILEYCPPRTPEWKGSIERFFGTINSNLIHNMPGTTRSNPQCLSEDENPMKAACINFKTFLELIHKWSVDVYSQSLNKGAGGIPSKIWERAINEHPVAWPNATSEFAILLGRVAKRQITKNGIQLNNIKYNSMELNRLLLQFNSENKAINKKFKVKYDPYDISNIYVYDDIKSCEWIKVPSTYPEYTKDLTEWEHKEICKLSNEEIGQVDIISLARSKKYLYDKINEDVKFIQKSKKKKINSTIDIIDTVQQEKMLESLNKENDEPVRVLNIGSRYNPLKESDSVIIPQQTVQVKKTKKKSKIEEAKLLEANKKDENKEIEKDNNLLEDIDLSKFDII